MYPNKTHVYLLVVENSNILIIQQRASMESINFRFVQKNRKIQIIQINLLNLHDKFHKW